jgi:putative tryptophan/tyrosine transport system substrate-binding protein
MQPGGSHRWRRRQLVLGAGTVGLGLLAGCGRLPGPAQRPAPRVGFLSPSSADSAQLYVAALQQGLAELGWVEHQNIAVDYRFADGHEDRVNDLAAELVGSHVSVIVTEGGPTTDAAKRLTSTIPIVFGVAADPVGTGLITSLPHPGGNVTGLTTLSPELAGKRLELLRELVPSLSRVAVLWNVASADKAREFAETATAAQTLGIQVYPLPVREPADLESAFELARREEYGALATLGDPLTVNQRARIVELAATNRLPAIYPLKLFVNAGGLMNYGPSISSMFRRAAYYVDRVLSGTSPADLPVEQPREFELVINLKTAQALSLTIPPHVLLQATEIVQ